MDPKRCQRCGEELPCPCGEQEAREPRRFSLLSPDKAQGQVPRYTGLLREVKGSVLEEPMLREEGRPLLARVKRLGHLVDEGEYSAAQSLVEDCLGRLVEFPREKPRRRWWIVPVAVLLVLAMLAITMALLNAGS